MALNDAQYRINALEKRLTVLETQAKASPALARPQSPLYAATSSGSTITGVGVGQDSVSRSISTAVQSALSSAESLQYAFGGSNLFTHNPGAAQTITSSVIRPDPVVGQQFRIGGGGLWINNSGGAITYQMSFTIAGVTILTFCPAVTVNNGVSQIWFFTMLMNVAPTAGASGSVNCTSVFTVGVTGIAATDYTADAPLNAANLEYPTFAIVSTSSATGANIFTRVDEMIYESLGFRTG